LRLSQAQEALILATAKANPNTVVVVQAGGPIDMSAWASKVRAIVYAWYPGGQGGLAVADVLFGTVNPSGRLPISFPKTWEDSPVAAIYPGVDGVANYTDDVFVGYRYFDLHPHQQAYRFGYGLSYTQFVSKITQVRGLNNTVSRPEIEVRAQVKNTGSRAGNTLVQLYVGASHATLLRPVQELKAFKKVFLQPGQTSEVLFTLDAQAFRYFDEQSHQWLVAPGAYQLNLFSATAQPESKKTIKLVAE
jgi:beta-glucosidase